MDVRKQKNDKDTDNTTDGGKKFITTMLTLVGVALLFIFFITFIFWLMTKDLSQ
jgi:hypothetical protein